MSNPHWFPSAQELRKIESAAKNTTATPAMIASWLPGSSVAKITQIVNDVRAGAR